MNWDVFGTVVNIVAGGVILVAMVGITARFLRERFSPVKKVRATVVNKQTFVESRIEGRRMVNRRRYVVTFLCGEKKMHFDVLPDTFERVSMKQTGMLQYKGSKLLDFE